MYAWGGQPHCILCPADPVPLGPWCCHSVLSPELILEAAWEQERPGRGARAGWTPSGCCWRSSGPLALSSSGMQAGLFSPCRDALKGVVEVVWFRTVPGTQ